MTPFEELHQIAVETGNRLTIVYDPAPDRWKVTIGPYQSDRKNIKAALRSINQQRSKFK